MRIKLNGKLLLCVLLGWFVFLNEVYATCAFIPPYGCVTMIIEKIVYDPVSAKDGVTTVQGKLEKITTPKQKVAGPAPMKPGGITAFVHSPNSSLSVGQTISGIAESFCDDRPYPGKDITNTFDLYLSPKMVLGGYHQQIKCPASVH